MRGVLYFGFESEEDRKMATKSIATLRTLFINGKIVEKTFYENKIKDIIKKTATESENEILLPTKFILFCGLFDFEIKKAISNLKKCGIGKNVLKAVLTKTNEDWDILSLAKELVNEFNAVNNNETSVHKQQVN